MLEAQSPSRNAADEIFGPPVTESAVMESVRLGSEPESFGTQESLREESVSFGVPPKEVSADGELHIRMSDPDKKGDGMNAYITFKVTTKTTMPTFKNSNPIVERRYSDFLWLHSRLEAQYKGYIIPPLPEKNSLSFNRFTPEFIEYRRKELEKFLRRVAEHPTLRKSPDLVTFLEANDECFQAAKQSAAPAGADVEQEQQQKKGIASSVFSFFGSATQKVTSVLTGPGEEVDEFFKQRAAYFTALEQQMSNLARASEALAKQHKTLVESYVEFGKASSQMADAEAEFDKDTSNAFHRISNVAIPIGSLYKNLADEELTHFEHVLRDHIRYIGAVKEMLNYRLSVLGQLQAHSKSLAEKRERVKSASGSTAHKLHAEIAEDEKVEVQKKEKFETVTKTAREELNRFEATKTREIREAVTKLIQFNMNLELQIVDMWKKFLANYQKDA